MNKYQEKYNSKKITVEEALSKIKSNDVIAMSNYSLEPMAILGQLHTIKDRVENVTIWHVLGLAPYQFFYEPDIKGHFDITSFFYGPVTRPIHKTGVLTHQPGNLSSVSQRKLSHQKCTVFLGTVTPMDSNGYVQSSLSLIYEKEAIETADLVIVEVNPNLPKVYGDTEIHIDQIDYVVEVDRPIPCIPSPPLDDISKLIGEHVNALVNDGDCIQLGFGTIANACAQSFMNKKDLGVHTEMIGDSMADLVEAGVINGSKKTINKGKMVGAFALGSQRLYDFINNNPSISLRVATYCNDPYIIGQNDNMVSINNALMVDLTGQVNSETINGKQFGGSGGAADTVLGAMRSKNGRSILTLPSTTKKGTVSTIQPFLPLGSVVTILRTDVDYIVTEYGIAPMRGRTIRERVYNLIAVAHPDFRKELKEAAFKNEIW